MHAPSKTLLRILALFVVMGLAAYLLVSGMFLWAALLAPLLCYQMVDLYRFQEKMQREVREFLESVHYRDFSRYFDVRHASADIQPLRQGFNEINTAFKVISKEKETQYQYLQKVLELVDTGILCYDIENGEVVWMNETLKRMLEVPYLKTIHSLSKRNKALYEELLLLTPNKSQVTTIQLNKTSFKALLSASVFQVSDSKSMLVAFQNVNEALDETESQAWQKLLSVMTHEIMNSVAPISSLAETLKKRLQAAAPNIEEDAVEDLGLGIDTIKRRSEGLLKFAETYRSLNKINSLNLKQTYLREVFGNLYTLMQPTFDQKGSELEIILRNPDLHLQADEGLLEQVLINLVVNALDAVRETQHSRVVLSADQTLDGKVVVKVADNGTGMPEEVMDKIFIPFFSTKKNGSGIGLSLCKQIMLLHKGMIQVQSVEGQGTVFVLQFS